MKINRRLLAVRWQARSPPASFTTTALVSAAPPAHARRRSATRSWGGTHEADRICAGAFNAPFRHARRQCPDAIVVAAARQRALPVEMGCGRRARCRQPREAAVGA